MGKKIPLLILTLTISTLTTTVPNQTFATVRYDDTTWWSVSEMLDFYQEVEREKTKQCGEDLDCIQEFNSALAEKGEKYMALANLIEGQFWITSVNPKAETIKVLFFDQDMMLARMGEIQNLTIDTLYLAWFDSWDDQYYDLDYSQLTNNSVEGLHIILNSYTGEVDVEHLPAWQEVEISVPGSNLNDNLSGRIDYGLTTKENTFNAGGYFNYSSCINAPEYSEGAECKMMISTYRWVSYLPPVEEIVEPTSSSSTTEAKSPEDAILEPGKGSVGNNEIKTSPRAPETGTATYPAEVCSREIHFPWWLVGIITLANTLIIWWFMPSHKKSTKYHKNRQKKS